MKTTISLLALFFISNFTLAQWHWQNPLPQGNTLRSVKFISPSVGWAVGDAGTILKTTNGGITWNSQTSGTPNRLNGVSFTDANTGTAVGYNGTIIRTTNGGASWSSQTSGTTNYLVGVSFTDSNTGTVVGDNRVLRTTNGGTTWIQQTHGTISHLNGVSFTDANTGTAVGANGTIIRTTNGGTFWTSQTSGTINELNSVSFTDASTGTAVGELGQILRTTNGGATWTAQLSGTTNPLHGVTFIDANTGTVVGLGYGTILRTTNGGVTWTPQTSELALLFGVSFTDANTGTAVGGFGQILRTTNGGITWTVQTTSAITYYFSNLLGVSFIDANTGTAVGELGQILRTTNGGVTWTSQISGPTDPLYGVSFTDSNTGNAVGSGGRILKTTNGGVTWTSQTSGTTNSLRGVSFTDVNTGTAVGNLGTILRTTNGGAIWTTQTSGITNDLRGVSFTDSNIGTVVGNNGRVLRTTNGGTTWIQQTSGTAFILRGVSFTDSNTGTAVGSVGTILRTTNGGTTWTIQTSGTTNDLYGVSFTDSNTGNAVGLVGRILKTTNGGATWSSQTSGTTNDLYGVSFTDANTGTTVGLGGTILRTEIDLLNPILSYPADGSFLVNDLTPDLAWQPYSNANYFHIQVDDDLTFSSPIAEELNWLTLNFTPTLPSFGTYYWRVKAHTVDNNWSPWSVVWSFTITDAKIVVDSIAVSSGGLFTSYLPNDAPINVGDIVRMKCRILTPTNTPIPNTLVDVLDQTIYNIEIGDSGIVSTVSDSNGEFYYPDADGYVQPYSGLVGLVFNPKGTENLTPLILRVYSDSLLIDNINYYMRDQLQLAHLQGISTEFDSIYFFYDEVSPLNVPITAVGDSMSYSKATLESLKQRGVINDFIEGISSMAIMQSVLPSPFSILIEGGFESYLERRRQFIENLPAYLRDREKMLSILINPYERYLPVVQYTLGGQKLWSLAPVILNWAEQSADLLLQRHQNILCPPNITTGCQEMCFTWLDFIKSSAFYVAEEIAVSQVRLGTKFYKNLGIYKKLYSYVEKGDDYVAYAELLNSGWTSIEQSWECIYNSFNELRGVKQTSYINNNQFTQTDSVYGPAIFMTLIDAVQFSDGIQLSIQNRFMNEGQNYLQDSIDVIIQTPTQCFTNDGNPTLPTVTLNTTSPFEVIDLGYNSIAGKYEYEAKFALSLATGSTNTLVISGQDIVGNIINYTSYFEWGTVIPPTGGSINLQNGLSISVPTGGFADSTQVSLIPVTSLYANRSNHFVYAALLDASSQFVLPAQLTLPFGQIDSLSAENLKVYKLDEQNQTWVNIPNSIVNYQGKIISAPISASGIYAVGDTTNTVNIVLTPTTVDFNGVLPGTIQDETITIINSVNSTTDLIAEIIPPNAPFSIVGSSGPFILEPGSSQQIIVRFSPVSYDSSFDKIIISHNAPSSIDTIPIYGVSLLQGMTLRNVDVNTNWNLISLPVAVLEGNPVTLFPSAISPAYGYSSSYFSEDTLKPVTGYWLKFPSEQTIELAGYPLIAETISVAIDWNMIGSLSSPIATASITSIPGELITSQIFGYQPTGYFNSDSINAGKGYWVKVSQAGQLVLSTEETLDKNKRIKIVFTNELPPPPPQVTSVEEEIPLPAKFAMEQNYPNPFNPSTMIKFAIPKEVQVNINLYNILGERVKELKNELMKPGYYQVEFNASNYASGIYFYRIIAGDPSTGSGQGFVDTKKMILLK